MTPKGDSRMSSDVTAAQFIGGLSEASTLFLVAAGLALVFVRGTSHRYCGWQPLYAGRSRRGNRVISNQLGLALRTLRGGGIAMLLGEQNATFAMKLAERLYVLEKGVNRQDETVEDTSRETLNRLLVVGE